MLAEFTATNLHDEEGNPTGGLAVGMGMRIEWQHGPLGRGEDRKEPNGAFVETVIAAAKQRIEFYQESRFACEANEKAIEALGVALEVLDGRTKEREEREVEGEHIA